MKIGLDFLDIPYQGIAIASNIEIVLHPGNYRN